MKKWVVLFLLVLLISGCSKDTKNDLQKKLESMGNDYYSKYMIGTNLDIAVISLKDLKDANDIMGETYDISKFSKCSDESNVKIYLEKGTTQIEKYEYELKCK